MNRPMRRFKQALSEAECYAVLDRCTHGVLAVSGDDGYPYAVPLSYVTAGGKVYFHSAVEGYKIDALRNCDKVCFTVVDADEVVAERFTTYFRSVIVFGRARILTNPTDLRNALNALAKKYSPHAHGREQEIESSLSRVAIIELTPDAITGKEARELAVERKK